MGTWTISLTFGKQRTHEYCVALLMVCMEAAHAKKTATWIISPTFGKQQTHEYCVALLMVCMEATNARILRCTTNGMYGSNAHKNKQQDGSFRSLLESNKRTNIALHY